MRTIVIMLSLLAAGACHDTGTDLPPFGPPDPGSAPVLTGVFPDSAAVGDTILIVGNGFGDTAGASVVTIGGISSGTIVLWTSTRILVGVPPGAVTGSTTVTAGGQTSNAVAFRVQPLAEVRVSYAGQVVPLFTSNGCPGCHGGTNGLYVTPHSNLMAGTSVHGPVVTPYDGEGSVIVKKLRGTAGFGNRMPQGGTPLTDGNIEVIARWIKQGARDN